MISQSWKTLPPNEKAKWQHKAQLDRERYEREKAEYKGPWKIPDVKDPTAPKKPMSAFLAFGNERRRAIAEANPTMNGTEISCLLSKLWRECPTDVKESYRAKEAQEREIYKQRRAEWERQKKEREPETDTLSEGSDEQTDWMSSCQESSSVQTALQSQNLSMDHIKQHDKFQVDVSENFDAFEPVPIRPSSLQPSSSLVLPVHEDSRPKQSFSLTERRAASQDKFNPYPFDFGATSATAIARAPATKFENYSMEEVLEDDELFEDFSPSDVIQTNSKKSE